MSESKYQKTERLFAALVKLTPDEQNRLIAAEYPDDPGEMARLEKLLATARERGLPSLDFHDEQPSPSWQEYASTEAVATPAENVQLLDRDVHGPDSGAEKPRYLGKYRLLRLLGEGGMGSVYEAINDELGQHVAIKVLRPHIARDAQNVEQFVNEARAAVRTRHPGIVGIYDAGRHDGDWYIVMELLEGENLAARLRREARLPEEESLRFARQVASALAAAHDQGVVHRDLKPDNIFLARDPEVEGGERIKLIDFGLARLVEGSSTTATQSGVLKGTPAYMSPEQCKGSQPVDHRSDLYSLGVVLFRMLCGRLPFEAESVGGMLLAHMTEPAPSVRTFAPDVTMDTAAVVSRLLAKSPRKRIPTAAALTDVLSQLSAGKDSYGHRVRLMRGHRSHGRIVLAGEPRIEVLQGDITKLDVDAIVNSDPDMYGTGMSVGAAIRRAAGPELARACSMLGFEDIGQAAITPGYRLPAKHVIHVIVPSYHERNDAAPLLAACYRSCLAVLVAWKLSTIAFPAMATGGAGFPSDWAARIALDTVRDVLAREPGVQRVIFCCYRDRDLEAYRSIGFVP